MNDDHHPLAQDWLEKQMGHKAYGQYAELGIDRTLVAIDCRRVRLCFILDFWRMIAAASIELILNPLTAKA